MNYYIVKCKLGHSGTGQYREISFNIKAKNASDAIDKARECQVLNMIPVLLF